MPLLYFCLRFSNARAEICWRSALEYSLPPESTHEELCECQILWDAGNCVLWELRKQLSGDMPSAGHGHRGRHTKLLFAARGLLCQFECSNNVLLVESELWATYGCDL